MLGASRELQTIPFAGFVSDPCDGRTQGTTGMFDSLPYRNDAAVVLRRLARSLPLRAGVLGIATCDKGLPAMLMAVAGLRDLPAVIVDVKFALNLGMISILLITNSKYSVKYGSKML